MQHTGHATGAAREEWPMQEVVRTSGTTSRTLRHYQQVGLLAPSRTGHGGQRFYDRDGMLRLQRILVLRELGLGLAEIGRVLDAKVSTAQALRDHADQLERERARLADVVSSVRHTITMIDEGGELMAETMFNGFDHSQYREEVEERWGREAYADSDRWWRSLTDADKQGFRDELDALVAGFADASARGLDVHGPEVQELAARQYRWIAAGWGGKAPSAEAFTGLGQMYVDDPRFGKTYTEEGRNYAAFVRDAMAVYAQEHLD